jgi:hypothetical protein
MQGADQKKLPGIPVMVIIIAGCMMYAPLIYYIDEERQSLDGIFEKGNIMDLGVYAILISLAILLFRHLMVNA